MKILKVSFILLVLIGLTACSGPESLVTFAFLNCGPNDGRMKTIDWRSNTYCIRSHSAVYNTENNDIPINVIDYALKEIVMLPEDNACYDEIKTGIKKGIDTSGSTQYVGYDYNKRPYVAFFSYHKEFSELSVEFYNHSKQKNDVQSIRVKDTFQ